MNLRNRLFLSHMALLIVSLVLFTIISVVLLSSRPAPPQLTYQRLEALLPSLLREPVVRNLLAQERSALDTLSEFAETNDVRIILVRRMQRESSVVFDTAGTFNLSSDIQIQPENYNTRLNLPPNANAAFGRFQDVDGSEWLYSGIAWELDRPRNNPIDGIVVLIAQERPSESLQSTLNEFGSAFAIPLMQASLAGGVIAFGLAFLISRSIARPLQQMSEAAAAVAQGQYDIALREAGIHEVKSLAGAFNRMSAEVRNTQQSQKDFMANVSHDLKTPLTSIQGYSQAIIDGAARNPADAARIIHDEAERLNRMVTQLTDLARLEAGRLSLKLTNIDLSQLVMAIAQRLEVVALKKDITLHLNCPTMPKIVGDGDRLVQVFTNLMSNAIKYTPEGGEVWVRAERSNNGVQITIRDNGIGIPESDLSRIFERFYQVDKARGPERGTGLGLAITQEIVQAHSGTITIQSAGIHQGTEVTVVFPIIDMSTIRLSPVTT